MKPTDPHGVLPVRKGGPSQSWFVFSPEPPNPTPVVFPSNEGTVCNPRTGYLPEPRASPLAASLVAAWSSGASGSQMRTTQASMGAWRPKAASPISSSQTGATATCNWAMRKTRGSHAIAKRPVVAYVERVHNNDKFASPWAGSLNNSGPTHRVVPTAGTFLYCPKTR